MGIVNVGHAQEWEMENTCRTIGSQRVAVEN